MSKDNVTMTSFYLVAHTLNSLVFGYGHQLADSNFLKWMAVLAWALGTMAIAVVHRIELEERK